ncbi:MAG: CDC27 family protein [Polyangiaceae bacterium]
MAPRQSGSLRAPGQSGSSRAARAIAVIAALAGAVAVSGEARAGAPAAAANPAKEHFDAGQALFDKKKYEPALVLFKEAYEDSKSPNAHLMVGRTLLALGRFPEAYDELVATMREAGARADTEPKYAATRDAAAAEIAPLEAKVAKLVVTFSGPAPAGAVVKVNGNVIPAARLGTPMALAPGNVEIVGEGIGTEPQKRAETIKAGETKTVVLTPPPPPAKTAGPSASGAPRASGAPTVAPAPSAAPDGPTTGGVVRKAGYGVAGVGVVGMVLFGVGAGVAQSKFDQVKRECGGVRCTDAKYADIIESGKAMDTMSTIGLGVGIAGLVGGAAMIVFGGPKPLAPSPAPKSAVVTPTIEVGPNGAMLRASGSF